MGSTRRTTAAAMAMSATPRAQDAGAGWPGLATRDERHCPPCTSQAVPSWARRTTPRPDEEVGEGQTSVLLDAAATYAVSKRAAPGIRLVTARASTLTASRDEDDSQHEGSGAWRRPARPASVTERTKAGTGRGHSGHRVDGGRGVPEGRSEQQEQDGNQPDDELPGDDDRAERPTRRMPPPATRRR